MVKNSHPPILSFAEHRFSDVNNPIVRSLFIRVSYLPLGKSGWGDKITLGSENIYSMQL